MRAVVIDDEPLARAGVAARLREQADVQLVGEFGDGVSGLAGLRGLAPDLALVDVQMPQLSGIDMLAALEPAQRPLVILLTAYDSFAVRAFELGAIDYLLKPLDEERFAEALQRARRLLPLRRAPAVAPAAPADAYVQRLSVRLGRRNLIVPVQQLSWIEADGDYAVLHAGTQSWLLREALHKLAQRLDPAKFVRIHRSAIVRIEAVASLQPLSNRDAQLHLRDGSTVRASRTYIEDLLGALGGGHAAAGAKP
ncbi:LytR/AlgR family response regulator transcription factor [Tahibacter harae]|uniref:LytTR family DNA-binding domain-containing protein n=1 Tax=Tahibacter harae TaxID=2963937 RepID=A0ABT1QMS2_9GAMM|nr:LytTR family DNA-binding domain-containing protein [Tahibacter harae]MCQ4163840.1 LytTR family DNA-binding domain-containing protein [Tahibacter harae]